MSTVERLHPLLLLRRQAGVSMAFGLLLCLVVGSLYLHDRQREWMLRQEQAAHRLNVAYDLISREVNRVRADALFLANQQAARQFVSGATHHRDELIAEYTQFVQRKATYDQIRLLDLNGREAIRVNYATDRATLVEPSELQDKSDRYYFQEALALGRDEVFVSEFDLNLEFGEIEKPLKPVIRFVTPVVSLTDEIKGFLVLNYLGAGLLRDLDDATLPGFTMLLRPDGHYLRSPDAADSWGWLLRHPHTFAVQFPEEWSRIDQLRDCQLTTRGAFAMRPIPLGRKPRASTAESDLGWFNLGRAEPTSKDTILAVSYLPRGEVFTASNELLQRLLVFALVVFVLFLVFARYWAHATLARQFQAQQIAESEEQLRDLSSRLLRIQEDERRAISREIHDEFGQQVTAINLDLKLAERSVESPKALPHLRRAIHENETLLQSLHEFATRVRPAVLDDLGLRDAIESHLAEFQQRTGVEVQSQLRFHSTDIPSEIADNTYRLLQESLNNVAKHAEATTVWVSISVHDTDVPHLTLTVRDNGRGCEGFSSGRGLGIIGMRERVGLLAGEMHVDSHIDQGTRIEIRMPLWNHPTVGGVK